VQENVTWFSNRDPAPKPFHTVLVLPMPLTRVRDATVVALLALVLVCVAAARPDRWPRLTAVASMADLICAGAALLAKQPVVLKEVRFPSGWSLTAVMLSGVVAVLIVLSFLPERMRPWAAVGVNAVATLLVVADLVHLRFFGDVISVSGIGGASQLGQVVESIRTLLRPRDLWLVADLLPAGLVAYRMRALPRGSVRLKRLVALVLAPALVPGLLMAWQIGHATSGEFVQNFQNIYLVRDLGVLNYHLEDLWSHARATLFQPELTDARKKEIARWFAATEARRAGTGPWFGVARGENLLMLQVESMQGFVIGMRVNGQEITPNLNRWREEALWFSHCSDQTAQGRTSDGELTTQVSLLPLSAGAAAFRYGGNHYDAVAGILRDEGYQTLAAVPFDGAFWNRLVTHPEYGYDTNLYGKAFKEGIRVGWGVNDRDFLRQMVPKLTALHQPFCAFLITLSNHHPYENFPDALKELDLGKLEGTSFGNYLHGMHFFDQAFGEFLRELEKTGLLRRTVIAVWGDHEAGFEWNDGFARAIGRQPSEIDYYAARQVPLLIRVPGATGVLHGERSMRSGHLDVGPTVLALLGVDPAKHAMLGRNLLGEPSGPVVIQYGAWLDDRKLYLPDGPSFEDGRCFDLGTRSQLPLEECRDEDRFARSEMEISRDVIVHDLRLPLEKALAAH
ncbi:MAG: LTA synthase family protein, partial [Thermoanaerobaculia bacterium]